MKRDPNAVAQLRQCVDSYLPRQRAVRRERCASHSEETERTPLTSRVVACREVGVQSRCRDGIAKARQLAPSDQVAPITGDYTNDKCIDAQP